MSTAAEKKARLLAKAQKSQKPIDTQSEFAISAHQQQQQQFAQQQQQQQQHQQQLRPSASASATAPAHRAPASGGGYGAYSDDMDAMDQTLYIDQDASNALKLKNKTQLGAGGAQAAAAQAQINAQRQQQMNAKQYAAQRAAASPQQPRSQRPQHQGSGPWEDDVEQFQQELSTPTPPASRRIGPSIGIGGATAGSADGVGLSPTAQQRHVDPVPVLDSAAEEHRLDALRAKKERAKARARAGGHGDAQQYEDSFSESHEYSVSASQQASPAPAPASAAAAAAAAAATGWVDPNTRLQQVQVRAAPVRSNRHRGGDELHEEDEQDQQDQSEGAAGEATQQATEQDDLDANDQAYQRALQQRLQDASAAAAASASSASAATDVDPNDKQQQAYQHQLMLQAELAALTQMRAERGELSQEELRAATMRQKRPPLILEWDAINPQSFFNSTVPRGGWVQCRLIKRGGGFASFLHPRYELYTEEHQGGLFLATARKSSKTKPNYHLTTERFVKDLGGAEAGSKAGANGKQSKASAQSEDRPILKTSAGYAGKVAATLSRSDYIVYDSGYNASKSPPDPSFTHEPREEIGNISYKPHLSGKTPRKLAVLLPILLPNSHRDAFISREFRNEFLSSSLAYQHLWRNLQEAQQRARVPRAWMCLLNKPPRYHADTGQYVLDFCGRAPQVSVKNFQLVYPEEPDEVLFQLGRLDDENFSVDFRFPIAPIQAFAIALSSLDYKWTVD